jgi:hypothetical protein
VKLQIQPDLLPYWWQTTAKGIRASPAVLLSTYAHFSPSELYGFADILTAVDGIQAALALPSQRGRSAGAGNRPTKTVNSVVGPQGIEPWTDGLKEGEEPEE